MARRKNIYARKKRKIYPFFILLIILVIAVVGLIIKLFGTNSYLEQIDEVMSRNILKTIGSISRASDIDTKIYENQGIKYTNQHENINKITSFSSLLPEDKNKTDIALSIIKNLKKLEKSEAVADLPSKESGYYWFDISLVAEDNFLIFNSEKEINLDLYYDISDNIIYAKEKYYDEFNMKNNKVKLRGFKATDEYKKLIEQLVNAEN